MKINYPETWSQNSRDELDAMFFKARKNHLWFFHGGLSGPLWFSPDELQAEQVKGSFIWGADNWQLRDPQENLDHINRSIAALKKEHYDFSIRITQGGSIAK